MNTNLTRLNVRAAALRGTLRTLLLLAVPGVIASHAAVAQADVLVYSNLLGAGQQGAVVSQGPIQIDTTVTPNIQFSQLIADDITPIPGFEGRDITSFTFSVYNNNDHAVTARVGVQFYRADGTSPGAGLPNLPSTFLGGIVFDPFAFGPGRTLFPITVAPGFALPAGTFWAGVAFDDDNGVGGVTGITSSELNNLGQATFDPPTQGSSVDTFFATGIVNQGTPLGAGLYNFGGAPVANFAWQFTVVPEPSSLTMLLGAGSMGLIASARRRRQG